MDTQAIKHELDAVEDMADKILSAALRDTPPPELKTAADKFHALVGAKRELNDEAALKQAVMDVESSADQLVAQCKQTGHVGNELRQAIQDAHSKASALKHQLRV